MTLPDEEIEHAHNFVTEELNRSAKSETFSQRINPVYERLIEAAVNNETVTYGELAQGAETDKRHYLSKLLDGIGFIQKQRGEPPIDVLAVHNHDGRPADSFLELLDYLHRRSDYRSAVDGGLVEEIIEDVHQYYD